MMGGGMEMHNGVRPAAVGVVTAVSGNTISINSRQGFASTSATVALTVDATNATVVKNNATSSVSSIATGDMIVVQGTLSGTNVAATSIRDGMARGPAGGQNGHEGKRGNIGVGEASSSPFIGNGQPVVAGTVASVSGSVVTISTKSNVTYTVDTTNAKILNGQQTVAVSSINVGDTVLVQGSINGTSVAATSVVDQNHPAGATVGDGAKGAPHGFLGGIGQFFMHIFGF
jgi:hypothetical protein